MSIPFLSDIILKKGNKIQFTTDAGANAGAIDIDSSGNLVLSNTAGDVLLGDGAADVYIGDGSNNVDILFEQSGNIKADDSASNVTLTLGSSNTTLNLVSPNITGSLTLPATTINNKLTFTTATGYIVFDYEPATGSNAEYSSEVPLLKVDREGTELTVMSRLTNNGALAIGIDDTVAIVAGDTKSVIKDNHNYAGENIVFASEGGFIAYGFPNNDTTWSNRNVFKFHAFDSTAANNGLYIGDGGQTQFIDLNRNLVNINTITTTSTSAGAITLNGGTGVATTGAFVLRQNGDEAGNGIAITSSHVTSHRLWKDSSGNFNIGSSSNADAFKQDTTGNVTIEGTISAGSNKISGGEIEGTSLDINGTSDISGNAVFHGKSSFGATTSNVYNVHAKGTGWAGSGIAIESTTTSGAVLSLFNTDRHFQIASRGNTLDFRDITDSDTRRFFVDSTGHLQPGADSSYSLGTNSNRWLNVYADTLYGDGSNLTNITASNADTVDNLHAASFLRSDADDTGTGVIKLTQNNSTTPYPLIVQNISNGNGVGIEFDDNLNGTQRGYITHFHSDSKSYGSGASIILGTTESTLTVLADGKLMYNEGIYSKPSSGTGAGTRKDENWDTAYGWGNHASAGYATLASPAFTGNPTAPTQTAGNNTTRIATTAFVSTAVSNLVDTAPENLNTLNELAAALGDDQNFSTTVTNSIATKMPLAGGTFDGDVQFNGDNYHLMWDKSENRLEFWDNAKLSFGDPGGTPDTIIHSDGSDTFMTVRSGSSFMIGTNGGTPIDNDGKADFVVDINSNPQISLYAGQMQVGGTDMNWNSKWNYDGSQTNFAAWNTDIQIFTQGSSGASEKTIWIRPQGTDGTITTRAKFMGDSGNYLYGPNYMVSDGSNADGATLKLIHANNNTTDTIGTVWFGNNADNTLSHISSNTSGANNTSNLVFKTSNAGTLGTVLTLNANNSATFAGAISASNFSGSSSGTNTGDQDLSAYLTSVPNHSAALLTSGTLPIARLPEFIEEKYIYTSNDSNAVFLPMVKGGMYATQTSTVTGAILIKIPSYKSNMMQQFYVDIYEYDTGETMTFKVSGYNYNDTNASWYNTSVVNLSDDNDRDFTVRFGANTSSSYQYVQIGETNSTWSYPQVNVRDFYGGYQTSESEALAAFDVSFVTSSPGSASATHTNNFPAADSARVLKTARTLTIGSTGKTFNGGADVSWTLSEIGAQASGNYITGSGSLSAQDLTDIGNLSGTNTGDQDLSGYLLNTTDTFTGVLTLEHNTSAGLIVKNSGNSGQDASIVIRGARNAPSAGVNPAKLVLQSYDSDQSGGTNITGGEFYMESTSLTGANLTDFEVGIRYRKDGSVIDGFKIHDGTFTVNGNIAASNFSGSSSGTNTGDQVSSDFTHDDLTGYVANEHIDWTAENAGTIHSSNFSDSNTFRTIKVDTNNDGTVDATLGGSETLSLIGGTAITLSENAGVVTINGVAETYTAHDNISAASSVDNSGNTFIQDLTLDGNGHVTGVVSAGVSIPTHDNLTGYVANEHIDWTAEDSSDIHINNIPDLSGTYLTSIDITADTSPALGADLNMAGFAMYEDAENSYSIDLKDHSNYTWLRNVPGQWSFQSGTSGDDWTQSWQIYVPNVNSDGTNDNVVELGQRHTNDTNGEFKGIRIVKRTSSGVIDGFLQAGDMYAVGGIAIGDLSDTTLTRHSAGHLETSLYRIFDDGYHPNADAWTTARTITLGGDLSGSVSIDGSANVTLTATVANDSHSHSNYITSNANDTVSANTTWGDSNQARFGTGGDLKIQHNGTNSYIDNHTGHLYIRGNATSDLGKDIFIQAKSGEASIYAFDDADVELYYNNSKKFSTTSTGFECNGTEIDTSSNGGGYKIGFNVSDNFSFSGYDVAHYGISNAGNDTGGGIVLSGYFGIRFATNGSIRGHFSNTGTFTTSGDIVGFGSPSDISLKENIKPIDNALDKVCKLKGVTFDWKESDSILEIKEDIGFIAQDVQEVLPELIKENDNGKLSLRDKGIVPVLVEAIKELKAEIDELKKCNKCKNCNCNA